MNDSTNTTICLYCLYDTGFIGVIGGITFNALIIILILFYVLLIDFRKLSVLKMEFVIFVLCSFQGSLCSSIASLFYYISVLVHGSILGGLSLEWLNVILIGFNYGSYMLRCALAGTVLHTLYITIKLKSYKRITKKRILYYFLITVSI